MEVAKETKFGTEVTKGMRMMPNFECMHSTEKNASQDVTSILVMALSNQPEAFTLNLGDDQSRYLFPFRRCIMNLGLSDFVTAALCLTLI